jgi:uncharacterized protein (DUF433 family)
MMGKGGTAMNNLPLETDPLPIRVDQASGGALRVGPTRVTLQVVLTSFLQGSSPEEIVRQFPTLQLPDVYTVIGHYLRHRAEFDAYLNDCERRYEELKAQALANGQAGLKERLMTRLAARQNDDAPIPR